MLGVFSRVGLSVVRLMLGDPKTSTLSGNLGTQDGGSLEQSEEELGWDVFLRFRSRVLERRFRQQYNWASVECDKCTFSLMVLMGSMFVLCMLLVNGRNWGVTLFLGCIMVTMARLALIAFCRDWYETNRTMVLFCSHTLHSMLALMSSRSIPMPAYAEPEFLFAYLLRSPIMILLLVGFGMMIPFEIHCVSQLASCVASIPWVFMFCWRCENPDPYYNIVTTETFFSKAQSSIDLWLNRLSLVGGLAEVIDGKRLRFSLSPSGNACWTPILFMHLAVGYIVPCAFVYCTEAYRRFAFACIQVQSTSDRQKYKQHFRVAIILAVWMTVTFLQCGWLIITFAADRLQLCSSKS